MKPLFVLLGTFLIACIAFLLSKKNIDYRLAGRIAMASMLVFTAMGHFIYVEGMSAMIPSFLPFKKQLVFLTGVLEIIIGIFLLLPYYQNVTAWVLIVFLIVVLPANIYGASHHINYQTAIANGPGLAYLWFRIPLQIFFIIWVYISTNR
ncbi:DoxX family protein [Flagellimonas zhangzhouensis]|uniref:Uncharacterized membrane protein n=1 Tax=Flagellimonas zhangzhouensis TaxID=1073328 RepID=A0A1H2UT16_9FLAO|nr:DoxX family membrane protein [Allomuricauda zhangzhouensis]SDQ14020.1 Uncharacterized membrane protein [Allomuricauda zhangzhouensis]SDW59215.1 Uncharacterized membrane protein [Allomuricauda zhangzhouensis]